MESNQAKIIYKKPKIETLIEQCFQNYFASSDTKERFYSSSRCLRFWLNDIEIAGNEMELRNNADCRAVQLRNESLQRCLTYVRYLMENLQLEMESRPIEFILFKQSIERSRQIVLLQMLSVMIAALQDQGYRFSDLLKALSDYAAGEKDKVPEDSYAWQTVSSLLQMAAEEAEQKDRELP